MTLLDPKVDAAASTPEAAEQALIEEARRLRRRRWMIGCSVVALLAATGAAGYLVASGPPSVPPRGGRAGNPSAPGPARSPRSLAPTRSPDLIQPTTLAARPDGDLLILDSSRDQILELTRDGDLSVFAGDGRLGFSGDGGPARNAELDLTYFSSAGMAVAPDGTVEVFDQGNCRVRAISPAGIIRTVLRVPRVKVDRIGHVCPVTGMARAADGSIYVATSSEIERASATGQLVRVAGAVHPGARQPARLTASDVIFTPDALAFGRDGDLYVASFSPKAIYRLTPAGQLTELGSSYATQLTSGPSGEILAGTNVGEIQAITSSAIRKFYDVIPKRVAGIDWGHDAGFQEDGIAVTRTRMIYVDNAQGNGYGAATVLVRINAARRAALVPIRSSLASTLPKLGAPGFPSSRYPAAGASRGRALASCPSDRGLEQFTPNAIAQAEQIARSYLSSQFASDIAVSDRSWWAADFNDHAYGNDLGRHTVTGEAPASESPIAAGLARACGPGLAGDSIIVSVGRSAYSQFAGTLYFLDRGGHPLVYDVR